MQSFALTMLILITLFRLSNGMLKMQELILSLTTNLFQVLINRVFHLLLLNDVPRNAFVLFAQMVYKASLWYNTPNHNLEQNPICRFQLKYLDIHGRFFKQFFVDFYQTYYSFIPTPEFNSFALESYYNGNGGTNDLDMCSKNCANYFIVLNSLCISQKLFYQNIINFQLVESEVFNLNHPISHD